MDFKTRWLELIDHLTLVRVRVTRKIDRFLFLILFIGFSIVIYQIGFPKEPFIKNLMNDILRQIPRVVMILSLSRWALQVFIQRPLRFVSRASLPDFVSFSMLFTFDRLKSVIPDLQSELVLYALISILFIIRFIEISSELKSALLNPSFLFATSFGLVIMVGTALLLIPSATNGNIEFIDALFTSTSAVCVTGLVTVDPAAKFTGLGFTIILTLIQVGGLGLMTFTNFFSLLFRSDMSFKNQLMIQNLLESDKAHNLLNVLTKIVIYTLLVEFVGVVLITLTNPEGFFKSGWDSWKFGIFHAISAFCNAGFSTLPDGMYNINFRFNYEFQLIIGSLIVLGGIGFPVVIDLYAALKNNTISLLRLIFFKERFKFQARLFSVHTRLVINTTLVLLLVGTVLYFITEFNNVLKEHPTYYGKWVQSFFGSVTPRTAGFNTVNMAQLTQATVLIYLLLMWIGASPSSTGGGIKTTTFAIALSNIIALAKGKDRVELFRREISSGSIHRAFSIIFLSLIVIGSGVFLISIFEPEHNLTEIAFECFSAYSTVGLSLNLTPQLTTPSKVVLICTMFIGRVGMFTLLFAVFNKVESKSYRYPKESVYVS